MIRVEAIPDRNHQAAVARHDRSSPLQLPVANLSRPGAEKPLGLLSGLLSDPSPARVRETLVAIEELPDGRLYRREAWRDVLRALMIVAAGSDEVAAIE